MWTERLGIVPGITAIIGSGGKTTLLRTLGRELAARGHRVILCTSTKIYPFADIPCVTQLPPDFSLVCLGTPLENGKLAAPSLPFSQLEKLADYVLVEADGSHGLPLKAHLPHEPVIPQGTVRTICVVGLSGIGRPIREAVHRPERFAQLAGLTVSHIATPEAVLRVLKAENLADCYLFNQADAGRWPMEGLPNIITASLKEVSSMLVLIRGAGDIASGVALRLHRAGFPIVMTELAAPTTIRRTVSFSTAVAQGETTVEGITARRANVTEVPALLRQGIIPVLVDPAGSCIAQLKPDVLVDAILAKKNLGTAITDAPVVIALGPGFTAGLDCHAVVETMRGHTLGRCIYEGAALPNTAIPGLIGGFAGERVLRAPCSGIFRQLRQIGSPVKAGDTVGSVEGRPMVCTIDGILRGILPDGTPVFTGMKAGDVDPRCRPEHCCTVSDKALAVGGGVLEALLHLHRR